MRAPRHLRFSPWRPSSDTFPRRPPMGPFFHVYLNSVQQMVSGELAGEGLQTGFSRHGLPPQRAPLDTVYPLREHLNSVQRMVSGGYCEGLFPDTVCWTRLRNTGAFFVLWIKGYYHSKRLDYDINSPRIFWCDAHEILQKTIPPEFSDVMITSVVGGEAKDANPTNYKKQVGQNCLM